MIPLAPVAFLPWLTADPAPGVLRGREVSRALECERLSAQAASRLRPGQVAEEGPRGSYAQRDALHCVGRVLRHDLRAPQDEAALGQLGARATEAARATRDLGGELLGRTWWVESAHPSAQVSAKVVFATKNALMAQGLAVTDRAPTLAAGDLDVLLRMAPGQAWPTACARWAANGSLGADDALLALVQLDPRATALHAGVCVDGTWRWLR